MEWESYKTAFCWKRNTNEEQQYKPRDKHKTLEQQIKEKFQRKL